MSRGSRCSACRDYAGSGDLRSMRGRTRSGRSRRLWVCRRCMRKLHLMTNEFLERVRAEGRYWEKAMASAVSGPSGTRQ